MGVANIVGKPTCVTFYIKGVVPTIPTSQKINIVPMGVAWKELTQKFSYNPNNFGKVPPLGKPQLALE